MPSPYVFSCTHFIHFQMDDYCLFEKRKLTRRRKRERSDAAYLEMNHAYSRFYNRFLKNARVVILLHPLVRCKTPCERTFPVLAHTLIAVDFACSWCWANLLALYSSLKLAERLIDVCSCNDRGLNIQGSNTEMLRH